MQLLIASTSTVYGLPYLSYIEQAAKENFSGCKKILFFPYARAGGMSCDEYTEKAALVFKDWKFELRGAHEFSDPLEAFNWAEGIFTGGGNTFLLLQSIYNEDWFSPLQKVVRNGMPYMGTSAGANLCGVSIGTTNDMPIVLPPSLLAMSWIPYNINAHYLDPLPDSTHMGETRETRIAEFHHFNAQPVIGLREGSFLKVKNGMVQLGGPHSARLFRSGQPAVEIETGSTL